MTNRFFAWVLLLALPGVVSCGVQSSVDVSSSDADRAAAAQGGEVVTVLPQREASLTTARKAVLVTILQEGKPLADGQEFEFIAREGLGSTRDLAKLNNCSQECRFDSGLLNANLFLLKTRGKEFSLTGYAFKAENANVMKIEFDFR